MTNSIGLWKGRRAAVRVALATALAWGAVTGRPAAAGDFTVTTDADSGAGSLRSAIDQAILVDDNDTITFALPGGSTINLLSALPTLSGTFATVTLDAAGNPITIDGSDAGIAQPWLAVDGLPVFLIDVSLVGGTVDTAGLFGAYEVDVANAVTLGSDFTGDAFAFEKIGAGTATIAGQVTLPSAISNIRAGTLELLGNDVLFSVDTLNVLAGATLAGNPTGTSAFAANQIDIMGRVAPSTTTGTLPLLGATNFASGSTLEVDLLPGDAGDRVDVTGAVTIESGARLVTLLDPNAFAAPSTVTVLTGDSIAGSFDFDGSSFLFVEQTILQDATSISVLVQPRTTADLVLTPNQQRVLDVVNQATPDATGDLATVQGLLGVNFAGTTGSYRELLDAIGGETLSAFATARQILGERTARALHRRARDPSWGEARAVYANDVTLPAPVFAGPAGAPLGWRASAPAPVAADAAPAVSARGARNRVGAWLDAFGQVGELEGDGRQGSADIDSILYGGTLGVDVWLAEKVVLGLAGGYARADLDPDGREVDATSDTIHGAVYAGIADARGYLSGYGRYALSFQDSTRRIESAQLQREARASWDAEDIGVGAEAGVTLLSIGDFGFQPIAGIDWLRLSEDGYRESGAGALSLDVDPEDLESTTGRVGARIFGSIDLDGAGFLVPEIRGFWQREFGDRDRVLRARLLGAATGGALVLPGAELPRDVVILGVGWSADIGETIQVLLDYDALLDSDRVEHQGNLALRVRF